MTLPLVLSLLVGCDPHDATVSGDFAMYFAQATSSNILRVEQSYPSPECKFVVTDPLSETIEEMEAEDVPSELLEDDDCWAEHIAAEKKFQEDYNLQPIDCRTFDGAPYNSNPVRIRDSLIPGWEDQYEDFCCEEAHDDDEGNDPDGNLFTTDDCTVRRGRYSTFPTEKAFYLHRGGLESYREEAVLTAEGDLQLTVHVTTQFGDMRLGWVIDPNFSPTECVEDEDGNAVERSLFEDGNWIDGWSKDVEAESDGKYKTVFHLNAGAVQANPNKVDDYWYFHRSWSAGAAFSRFGDEDAYMFSTDYIDYAVDEAGNYSVSPMWVGTDDDGKVVSGYGNYGTEQYPELNCGGEGDSCRSYTDYADFYQAMTDNFNDGGKDRDDVEVIAVDKELEELAGLPHEEFPFHVRMEDNSWRHTAEGAGTDASGFDGWVSANPNWVRFDWTREELEAITTGTLSKPLKGDFQMYMYSSDNTGSVWFYRGEFVITKVAEDVWGYDELDEIKREENGTPECGE